jgi:hypothetical protein
MPWSGTSFGLPQALLLSAGENNYYPAFSSDGAFVIMDRVMGKTGTAADAFSNAEARVWAMPAAGGAPVDLAVLNQGPGLSNSWPRWSPQVQQDRGHAVLWVTFSSVRDYGARVQNQDPHAVFCYPPETPENPSATGHPCPEVPPTCGCASSCADYCVQPQLWMAAVEVDATGGIAAGIDTSHPAFWLPFQEITAHNHTAEWTTSIPNGGSSADGGFPQDGGTVCGLLGAACGVGGLPMCCSGVCSAGICGP